MRTDSSYSSNGIIEELEPVLTFLKKDKVSFRGDSAFYDTDLMEFLEQRNVDYYIRCKNYHALYTAVEKELSKLENPEQYTAFNPYYSEIIYSIAKKKERRIVYKTYWVSDKNQMTLFPAIYAVVTNDSKMSSRKVTAFYEKRGASENFTKELKNDFNGGTLSHQRFEENEIQFLISSLAYNVYHLFQNDVLDDDDKKMTMNSYRLKFQKIAVRVIRHVREVVLSFSSSYRYQNNFLNYWNTVLQL